jgi:3-oxoacyl-[acyl-carrier protein] reductase
VSGRCILITGATRGIGRCLAEHYLALGDTVVGCGRGAAAIEHEAYMHASLDVCDEAAVSDLFSTIRTRFGRLDVLINNAGVASMNVVALTPSATARRVLDTNVLGTFLFTHAGIRLLRRSPHPRIVNLTSVAVPLSLEGEAVYAASKSAVETFTRIVARELGSWGITCNAIGPSPIRTDLTRGVPEEAMARLLARQAVPRSAEASDVANVIDFFLHPASALVTGQVMYLGGVS